MNLTSVNIDVDLGDDKEWDALMGRGHTENLRDVRSQIIDLLGSLDVQASLRRADFLEKTATWPMDSTLFRTADAEYNRWKAGSMVLRRMCTKRKDQIDSRLREVEPPNASPRLAMFKLAKSILNWEADEDLDDDYITDLLDDITIHACRRTWTLREWLTEGKAKW